MEYPSTHRHKRYNWNSLADTVTTCRLLKNCAQTLLPLVKSHVTHLQVLSRIRHTLRQLRRTVHIIQHMDVPNTSAYQWARKKPRTGFPYYPPFSVSGSGSCQSIHPIPPTHFFRFEVRHWRHSLPVPTSTTAHIPHTLLPQQPHPNSASLTSSSPIPPMDISGSG